MGSFVARRRPIAAARCLAGRFSLPEDPTRVLLWPRIRADRPLKIQELSGLWSSYPAGQPPKIGVDQFDALGTRLAPTGMTMEMIQVCQVFPEQSGGRRERHEWRTWKPKHWSNGPSPHTSLNCGSISTRYAILGRYGPLRVGKSLMSMLDLAVLCMYFELTRAMVCIGVDDRSQLLRESFKLLAAALGPPDSQFSCRQAHIRQYCHRDVL